MMSTINYVMWWSLPDAQTSLNNQKKKKKKERNWQTANVENKRREEKENNRKCMQWRIHIL